MSVQDLSAYRQEIDAIDVEIVALLVRRFAVAAQVAQFKQERGIAVRLQDRIAEVLDRVGEGAIQQGLEPTGVQTIYKTIIETTCRFEEAKINS